MNNTPNPRTRLGTLAALVATVCLALGLGACGSSSSSSGSGGSGTQSGSASTESSGGSGQAAAKAAIDKARQLPQFALKAPPVDLAKAKGKTIFNIPLSSTIPYIVDIDKQMQMVAEAHGVNFIEFSNQGTPTQWAQGVSEAIQRKADVIVLQASPNPESVVPALQKAKAAGIPVVVTHLYQDGTKPPANVRDLIAAYVTGPFATAAELMVDYPIAEDGCDAVKSTLIITANEVAPSQGIVKAMQDQLQKRCPDAKATVINVPAVDWGTKIAPETQSELSKDPSIKWVLPIYDSMSLGAVSGIRAAGKTGQVHVASYNGTPAILKLIEDSDIMSAEMGENVNWLGYANMDQIFRVLAGGPILKDGFEGTPLRVFDDSNVDETGTPPTANKGYGDAYVKGYDQLWKTGG